MKKNTIDIITSRIIESLDLEVPINVELAVERLGGKINRITYEELKEKNEYYEAKIEKVEQERFIITLLHEKYIKGERLLIAHELGHLFLHMKYLKDNGRWTDVISFKDISIKANSQSQEEKQADAFACSFLLPENDFKKYIDVYCNKFYEQDIIAVANIFNVPISTIHKRIYHLRYFYEILGDFDIFLY
jgi:Zn-dependent peptidase ImmA (M78 family)